MMSRNTFLVLLLAVGIGCSSEQEPLQPTEAGLPTEHGPRKPTEAGLPSDYQRVQAPVRPKVKPAAFAKDETEHFLAIVADVSGSYKDKMIGEHGLAFDFLGRLLKSFFLERTGATDRMLLSQISASDRARIFDGAPRSFKRTFKSKEEFRDFVLKNSDARSSRVYDSISDTIDRLCLAHSKNPELKSSLIVFSDLLDNSSGPDGKKRFQESLAKYAQCGGIVGLYWVDDKIVSEMDQLLRDAGFQDGQFVIESGIKVDPQLPSFDWAS